jgi:cell wall-associated NlpC family hydrolase
VEFLPQGRHGKTYSRGTNPRRAWGRVAALASSAALVSLALPGGIGNAQTTQTTRTTGGTPSGLTATVAKANQLSNEIDNLGQQYDQLRIELTQARSESAIAHKTALRDEQALGAGQDAVAQIAAEGYMTGSFSPTLQLLQSSDPQQFLNRASIILQLGHEQNGTVSLLQEAEDAANRANLTATQEATQAALLSKTMSTKVAQIQAKENVLNSSAFHQALLIFDRTGNYPDIAVRGDSLGAQALRWALTRVGDPYVWAAAGPNEFDCSGLVMWAYAQVGISLQHFTGAQWTEGEHVPQSEIEPGDLLFFFNIDHVGLYVGDGLMVDAPTQGQDVQVQPVLWGSFDGAVRIVA